MTERRFHRFALIVLVYNVAVILLGTVVRATESGAGCGTDWPACRGSLIPSGGTETMIEFSHRATSGVALMLVAILVTWAVRAREPGDPARATSIAAGVFILGEALIGAMLVLFEWVADDESVGRVISISIHLVNTFFLIGSLALTAWFAAGKPAPKRPYPPLRIRPVRIGAGLLLLVGATGAITALGDTLFPPAGVGAGFFDDLAGTLIVRLRWIHPILALVTAGYLWRFGRTLTGPGRWLQSLVYTQVVVGVVNVALLAPLWLQLVHLLVADAIWITFTLAAVDSLAERGRVPA